MDPHYRLENIDWGQLNHLAQTFGLICSLNSRQAVLH
jgi:hypothetical protein